MSEPECIPFIGPPTKWEAESEGTKYASWPQWWNACDACGTMILNCWSRFDSGSHYTCDGCCGWPFCSCRVKHKGDCDFTRGGDD